MNETNNSSGNNSTTATNENETILKMATQIIMKPSIQ